MNIDLATANLGQAAAQFQAFIAQLDDNAMLESMGYKRVAMHRLHSEANVTVTYPGGTDLATATVTHTLDFNSAYQAEETELHMIWSASARVHSNGEANAPRSKIFLSLTDGTDLSNVVKFGTELTNTPISGYADGVVTSSAKYTKAAGVATVTFEQRCYMENGAAANTTILENADLLIVETVK